jgi:tRNA threonylcarbamoyl adenosine modification protein YeaZ
MSVWLALEWSSPVLSAAIDASGRRWEQSVRPDRFGASEAYGLLQAVLRESGHTASDVTGLCVGRGPGNYSGMRVALAWAAGLAAPGGVEVVAVSSVRAQAWRLWQAGAGPLRILGDARRQAWWGMEILGAEAFACPDPVWSIAPPETWSRGWTQGPTYSADPVRLPGMEDAIADVPRASDLLDFRAAHPGLREPALPLYPHPPV